MSRVAPEIAGFTYVSHLGSGGFADVFLYEQRRPSRRVAVKVLLADRVDAPTRAQFDAEADLMALLSNHPNIVTIYQADITDGRPYLVMEYCSNDNLGVAYKAAPLKVDTALHATIQIAGAVETVHRAGILHRDIKPANVLVTAYNVPVLTDFGISVVTGDTSGAQGLSIPWAPPEAIADTSRAGIAADVYSLAATLYTLLAGRTPFELPGGDNSMLALVARIEQLPVPALGRADIPPVLEQVLRIAMAKDPAARYPTALLFARALQQVQTQLQLPMTSIDVREDDAVSTPQPQPQDDEPGTRVRSIMAIDPNPPPPPPGWETRTATRTAAVPTPPAVDGGTLTTPAASGMRQWRLGDASPESHTVLRTPAAPTLGAAAAEPRRRSRTGWVVAASILALAVAAGGVFLAMRDAEDPEVSDATPSSASPVDALGDPVPLPEVTMTRTGNQVEVSWTSADPQPGDYYMWSRNEVFSQGPWETTTDPGVSFEVEEGSAVCIDVVLRRADGKASAVLPKCVQAG